jgi:ribokinase
LKAAGVDVGDVRVGTRPTGMALIMVDSLANSTIAVVAGANSELDPARLEAARAPGPDDTVLVSLEIPLATAAAAAQWARRARARLLVDPAPAPEHLPAALWRADVLMPNRSEAERLLRVRIRDVRDAKAAARALLEGGARVGIVKLGGDGLVWAAKSGVFYVPAFAVEAVDTTGAGDVFAGSLAAALDRGTGWADAIREAAAAAALACTKPGTQTAAPTLEAVRRTGWL